MANNYNEIIEGTIVEGNHRNITYDQPIPEMSAVPKLEIPTYKNGLRLPTNSFGTTSLRNLSAEATSEEVLASFDSNFKVYKDFLYPDVDAYGNPLKGSERIPILRREDNNRYLCPTTEKYHTIEYGDAVELFFAILKEIKRHGYMAVPAYAKRYENASIFLQYKISGHDLVGEEAETYLTLLTSHNGKMALTLCLSTVRLFCQNQINRCLKRASNKWTVRHSSLAKAKIESVMGASRQAAIAAGIGEAQHTLNMIQENMFGMESYLEYLSKTKVSDKNIFDTMVKLSTLKEGNNNSMSAVTHFLNRMAELRACYNMPDVDKWRGTALGAYYAFSDMSDHIGRGNTDSYFLHHADGNPALEKFADTLIEIAK